MKTFTKIAVSKPMGKILNNTIVKKVAIPVGGAVINKAKQAVNFIQKQNAIDNASRSFESRKLEQENKEERMGLYKGNKLPSNIKYRK